MLKKPRSYGVRLNGPYLYSLRQRRAKSLFAMADLIGIDRRVLSKAENSDTVEHETSEIIAKFYGVEIHSILAFEPFTGPLNAAIIPSYDEVVSKNIDIISNAKNLIICFGSRSRDNKYLKKIEEILERNPKLIYKRIMFFKPFHKELQDHLLRTIAIRSPKDRSKGFQTLHLCVSEDIMKQPEINICMNETQANLVIPSVNMPGNYDTSLYVDDVRTINAWINLANDLCRNSKPIETSDDVIDLGVIPDGSRYV